MMIGYLLVITATTGKVGEDHRKEVRRDRFRGTGELERLPVRMAPFRGLTGDDSTEGRTAAGTT